LNSLLDSPQFLTLSSDTSKRNTLEDKTLHTHSLYRYRRSHSLSLSPACILGSTVVCFVWAFRIDLPLLITLLLLPKKPSLIV
jgi:hypothetical protein